jgi:hypothetical protein
MRNGTRTIRITIGAAVAAIMLAALAFATSATGKAPDPGREIVKLKREVAALKASAATSRQELRFVSVGARVAFVEAAGIHAMEGRYSTTGLTTRDIAALQNVLTLVGNAPWPQALADTANDLKAKCKAFLDAWNGGDKAAAFAQLQATHEAYHTLGAEAWIWLAQQAR